MQQETYRLGHLCGFRGNRDWEATEKCPNKCGDRYKRRVNAEFRIFNLLVLGELAVRQLGYGFFQQLGCNLTTVQTLWQTVEESH